MTATMDRTREDVMQAIERIAPVIEQHRDEGEQIRRLPDATMAAMRDAGLLRLWTPKEYGGDEVDLPVFMAAVEKAAELDSAAGWVMSTAAGGPLLTAFMPAAVAHELFAAGPDVAIPGASAPNGPERLTIAECATMAGCEAPANVLGTVPVTNGCRSAPGA